MRIAGCVASPAVQFSDEGPAVVHLGLDQIQHCDLVHWPKVAVMVVADGWHRELEGLGAETLTLHSLHVRRHVVGMSKRCVLGTGRVRTWKSCAGEAL